MQRTTELVKLNERWCIVDDPLQWILRRRGEKNGKFGPWSVRSFCTTRKALLRCIRDYCGAVDPAAVAHIKTWTERHTYGAVEPMATIEREAA